MELLITARRDQERLPRRQSIPAAQLSICLVGFHLWTKKGWPYELQLGSDRETHGAVSIVGMLGAGENITEWVDLVKDEIECLGNHDLPPITNPTILKDSQPSGAPGGCEGQRRPRGAFYLRASMPLREFHTSGKMLAKNSIYRRTNFPPGGLDFAIDFETTRGAPLFTMSNHPSPPRL